MKKKEEAGKKMMVEMRPLYVQKWFSWVEMRLLQMSKWEAIKNQWRNTRVKWVLLRFSIGTNEVFICDKKGFGLVEIRLCMVEIRLLHGRNKVLYGRNLVLDGGNLVLIGGKLVFMVEIRFCVVPEKKKVKIFFTKNKNKEQEMKEEDFEMVEIKIREVRI